MKGTTQALLLVALLLAGCSAGTTTQRQQHAANAIAGTQAMVEQDDRGARATIADGVTANIEGAVGFPASELPQASKAPVDINAAPEEYASEAREARDATLSSGAILGWLLGGLATAAGIVRVTGVGGPIVSFAAKLLENATAKRARAQTAAMRDGFGHLVSVIEDLPNEGTIGELKQRVRSLVPPEVEAVIQAVKNGGTDGLK